MTTLAARAVTYRAGVHVLVDAVDLDVETGQVLAVVGPNGAGKTTLLGLLAGDLRPTAGFVELDGHPLTRYRPVELARRRSVLPQASGLQFGFTVEEVVRLGRYAAAEPAADTTIVTAALAATDLTAFAARSYPTLSGGERARADLARVLAQDTPILLLDEPTASLDLRHQHGILRMIRALTREGRTVLVVLHDLNLAAAYADQIAILSRGRLAGIGPPRRVLEPGLIHQVFGHPVTIIEHPETGCPVVVPRPSITI